MPPIDIAIVGAGMAGASLAAELAPHARVMLIEAEAQPGYHSTGRWAAFWHEAYGGPMIRPLTTASGGFLRDPPTEFHEGTFLRQRGALTIARSEDQPLLEDEVRRFSGTCVVFERQDRAELEQHIPGLKPEWTSGLFEPGCSDIDVASLHGAYLRKARRAGAQLMTDARVTAAQRYGHGWRIEAAQGNLEAAVLVNAAGAWADQLAVMAGMAPIGIRPLRRTIAQLRTNPAAPADLPLVLDARGTFYFKPEPGGRLWLSPQDETAIDACDVRPEELDIAIAIDRFESAVDWRVERVEHSWAGLRSFAPDRLPVYGFDPRAPGFFWFVGQGGFGIQTAPAAAKLGASLLLGTEPPAMVAAIDPNPYSVARFID
jgi:D-arginine dehydrogenase